jgi:sigma-E factor negative regulatory protein RseC
MLETLAIVIRVEGQEAWVESTQGGGCGNCDSENGCGSSKLSQLFCSEPRRFRVRNEANAEVGTMVQVTVAEGVLLRSALLMYGLPLILMLAGAISGSEWAGEDSRDAYSAAGGLMGLIIGFVLVKGVSLRQHLSAVALPVISPSSR